MAAYQAGDQPIPGYVLETLLGRGSLGDCWKASRPNGESCALKFMNLQEVSPKDMRLPRALMRLQHENLCPIYGAWLLDSNGQVMTDGSAESIMIKGTMNGRLVLAVGLGQKTLAQRLQECRTRGMPLQELMQCMEDVARGLDYLHKPPDGITPVLHGNIKPGNMLLVGQQVQLCDYGLYRLDSGKGGTKTFSAGAPIYSAPEAISDEPIFASDQYSLAISYYELRTKQLPFEESKALISNLTGVLDFSALNDAEQKVLERATSKQPDARYPSCTDLVAALKVVVQQSREWRLSTGEAESSSSYPSSTPLSPPVLPPPPPVRPAPKPMPPARSEAISTGSFSDYPSPLNPAAMRAASEAASLPKPKAPAPMPVQKKAPSASATPAQGSWEVTPAEGIPRVDFSARQRSVEGQATVRYYSRMNPERLFPLLVVFSEQQLRQIVQNSVQQAVSQRLSIESDSALEVQPVLPGCEVYPPIATMQLTSSQAGGSVVSFEQITAPLTDAVKFYVLPKVLGLVEGATVFIRQNGVLLAEIPLDIVVVRQRWALFMTLLGLFSPYIMMGVKSVQLDPASQQLLGYRAYIEAGQWVTQTIDPLYVVIACLVLAAGLYLWCRPRRRDKFWDLETES